TVPDGVALDVTIFFFQAEDGIRDRNVTGVQTCALPIFVVGFVRGGDYAFDELSDRLADADDDDDDDDEDGFLDDHEGMAHDAERSEERRVGKGGGTGEGGDTVQYTENVVQGDVARNRET